MSYIDQTHDPRRRATAILGVGAVHAALGLAIIAGLTVEGFEKLVQPNPQGQQIPINPPPPVPTPEPVPSQQPTASAPTAPQPPVTIPNRPTSVDIFDPTTPLTPTMPIAGPAPLPTVTPALPPLPTPSFTPNAAVPRNGPAGWIMNDDYPASPLRRGIEGTVDYRLSIGSDGRVNACEVTRSAGNAQLDQATCRLLTRRARFDAATDASGAAVVGTYRGTVSWRIPE